MATLTMLIAGEILKAMQSWLQIGWKVKKIKRYTTVKPPNKPPKDSLWRKFSIAPPTTEVERYAAQRAYECSLFGAGK